MSEMLEKARKYEDEQGKQIKAEDRPAFHVSPYVGWMNDPNGFSYYQGEYHLFISIIHTIHTGTVCIGVMWLVKICFTGNIFRQLWHRMKIMIKLDAFQEAQ